MQMFLATAPLAAASGSATHELMPAYVDWIKHKLDPMHHPKRLVKIEKGLLSRIGKGTLHGLPSAAISGAIGGMLLDAYLHRKLRD